MTDSVKPRSRKNAALTQGEIVYQLMDELPPLRRDGSREAKKRVGVVSHAKDCGYDAATKRRLIEAGWGMYANGKKVW